MTHCHSREQQLDARSGFSQGFFARAVVLFSLVLSLGAGLKTRALAAQARLAYPELVAAGFTNGQRAKIIVNLLPPARTRQATDWNSAPSLRTLHTANHGVAGAVLATLGPDEHKLRFRFDNQPGFSCEVTPGALQKLLENPEVESVEPVQEMQAHLAQGIALINGMATRSTYDGSGLSIAICDTGVDYNHDRLGGGGFPNSKVIGGYDFGDSDADPIPNTQAHGTCCAGIAAGDLGTVGDYIGGVAPGAKLYACKISYGTSGSAYNDAMIAAWDWCVTHKNDDPAHPILVISTSFGGDRYFSTCDSAVSGMTTAANNAVATGITVLASSGNDGYCDSIAWPACISNVISVGAVYDASFGTFLPCISTASCAPKTTGGCTSGAYATDVTQADKVTSYSNVASFLDVFAPGNQCYTLDITGSSGYSSGDYYDSFGGTSAACPYAAGAVGCLQQAAKALTGSYLTPAQVRAKLAATGDLITDTKVAITKPRVNLGNAIGTLAPTAVVVLDSATLVTEGCLPGNGVIDPSETVSVSFALKNTGGSDTTNLVATLLATNGVATPGAPQSYGAVVAGGASATRTFSFTATGTCGGTVTAVLQLQDGTRNLGTVTNSFPLGAPGSAITVNYSTSTSTTIGNRTTNNIPLVIPDSGFVANATVGVRLDHTRDSDVILWLVHPDGTTVLLANQRGGSGDNYGSGNTNCSGTVCLFDDAAATPISSGSAPFAGTYRPEQLLSALDGKPVTGTWKLRVADDANRFTGTFYCFQLNLTRQMYACCTGTGAELLVGMSASPSPVTVGSNLTYTINITNLGPNAASGVTLTDALPATVSFVSAAVSQGSWATNGGGLFTGTLGTINAGNGATISLIVRPSTTNNLTNTASVASSTADPNLLNNRTTSVTPVNPLPPTITQSPLAQNVCPGSTAVFTVTATGAGTLFYQWQRNSVNLTNGGPYAGVGTSALAISAVDVTVLGDYRCVVTNLGGSTTSAAAALTDTDTAPPTISCPPEVVVLANAGCSATNVALGSPVTGDNCAVAAVANNAPASYPVGTNFVIWKVTDTSGNTNTCVQLVVVQDVTPPVLTCPAAKTVDCSTAWAFDPPTALDACSGTNITVVITGVQTNGTHGELLVASWLAMDASGNTNSCTQQVTLASPPAIIADPTNMVVAAGADAVFIVTATNSCGSGPVFQWRRNGEEIAGATTSTHARTNALCGDAGSYDVVLSSAVGSITSVVATLEVVTPPAIQVDPTPQTVTVGQEATFCVAATNDCGGQLTYQWRFNELAIPGATGSCYSVVLAGVADMGSYDVIVTNLAAALTSAPAPLTVIGPYLLPYPGSGTNFLLVFPSASGVQYVVEYKTNLSEPESWLPLSTNAGTGGLLTNEVPLTEGASNRFYRVLVP